MQALIETMGQALEPPDELYELNRPAMSLLADRQTPVDRKVDGIWEIISAEPKSLALGLLGLIDRASEEESNPQARMVIRELISTRIPAFLKKRGREERFVFTEELVVALAIVLGHTESTSIMPPDIKSQLSSFTARQVKNGWNQEERLLLAGEAIRAKGLKNSTTVLSNPALSEHEREISRQVTELAQQLMLNCQEPTNEQGLCLAAAASQVEIDIKIVDKHRTETVNTTEIAHTYLELFYRHFQEIPNGYLEAQRVIIKALARACEKDKLQLVNFLVGNESWSINTPEGFFPETQRSFAPILRRLIQTAKEGDQISEQTLKELIQASSMTRSGGEVILNPLIAAAVNSHTFSQEEKLVVGQALISMLRENRGFVISTLSDEELLSVMAGNSAIMAKDTVDGQPIYLITQEGEGRIIGRYETPIAITPQTNGHDPEVNIAESAREIVVFEEEALTREEQIVKALRKIFPQEISDEEIEALDGNIQALWKDVDVRNLGRKRTLNPRGTSVNLLTSRAVRAQNEYPHTELWHGIERQVGGIFSSDLYGKIALTQHLVLDFFIDSHGNLQGDPARLLNQGTLSWDLYWQLNHAILSILHERLTISEEELVRRSHAVAERSSLEIVEENPDGQDKKRRSSAGKIRQQLEESQRFLISNGHNPSPNVAIIEPFERSDWEKPTVIDLEQVVSEMNRSGRDSVDVWQELSPQEMEAWEREGNRGKVKPHPAAGTIVFLPYPKSPTRNAIANAKSKGIRLVKVTEVSRDSDLGVLTQTVTKSTFRSARGEPRKEEEQLDK